MICNLLLPHRGDLPLQIRIQERCRHPKRLKKRDPSHDFAAKNPGQTLGRDVSRLAIKVNFMSSGYAKTAISNVNRFISVCRKLFEEIATKFQS